MIHFWLGPLAELHTVALGGVEVVLPVLRKGDARDVAP